MRRCRFCPKGYEYFVQAGDFGPVKIGWTAGWVWDRIAEIQTGHPDELFLIHCIDDASVADEKRFHERFSNLRLKGEWFRFEGALADYVKENSAVDGVIFPISGAEAAA
jgi:hypothetical protein